MRYRLGWTCIFGYLTWLASLVGAQAVGDVAGRVVCADLRTPCRFASVTIQSAPPKDGASASGTLSHSYGAATDLEGAYTMKGVVPGEYYTTALQPGYLSPYDLAVNETMGEPSLKAQAAEIALERIVVVAGRITTANVQLARGASLSGTVRYEDGGRPFRFLSSCFARTVLDSGSLTPTRAEPGVWRGWASGRRRTTREGFTRRACRRERIPSE